MGGWKRVGGGGDAEREWLGERTGVGDGVGQGRVRYRRRVGEQWIEEWFVVVVVVQRGKGVGGRMDARRAKLSHAYFLNNKSVSILSFPLSVVSFSKQT